MIYKLRFFRNRRLHSPNIIAAAKNCRIPLNIHINVVEVINRYILYVKLTEYLRKVRAIGMPVAAATRVSHQW